jgi:hypothetical protein
MFLEEYDLHSKYNKMASSHIMTGLNTSQNPSKFLCNKICHTKSQWVYIRILSHKTLSKKNCRICMHGLNVVIDCGIIGLHTCRPYMQNSVGLRFFSEGNCYTVPGCWPSPFWSLIILWNGSDNFGRPLNCGQLYAVTAWLIEKKTLKVEKYNGIIKRHQAHL